MTPHVEVLKGLFESSESLLMITTDDFNLRYASKLFSWAALRIISMRAKKEY